MFLVVIVFVLNARGGHARSKSMRFNYSGKCAWSFRILLFLWVASVWAFQLASCCASGASRFRHRDKADNSIAIYNHSMPKRASGHVSVPEALGYKCISCSVNLTPDAPLIVTAVTQLPMVPHVQIQTASDLCRSQLVLMCLLVFFANTILRP